MTDERIVGDDNFTRRVAELEAQDTQTIRQLRAELAHVTQQRDDAEEQLRSALEQGYREADERAALRSELATLREAAEDYLQCGPSDVHEVFAKLCAALGHPLNEQKETVR